jgi:hypothetical protein
MFENVQLKDSFFDIENFSCLESLAGSICSIDWGHRNIQNGTDESSIFSCFKSEDNYFDDVVDIQSQHVLQTSPSTIPCAVSSEAEQPPVKFTKRQPTYANKKRKFSPIASAPSVVSSQNQSSKLNKHVVVLPRAIAPSLFRAASHRVKESKNITAEEAKRTTPCLNYGPKSVTSKCSEKKADQSQRVKNYLQRV